MLGADLIDLQQYTDARGSLVALENGHPLPFDIQRFFFVWDAPVSAARGEDAVSADEALIALRGQVTVDLDNGGERQSFTLSRPDQALYIQAGVWMRLYDFSPDALILVAASRPHSDTIRYKEPQPRLLQAGSSG
jgi:hypothetical protein